jgi:hypothetical protein
MACQVGGLTEDLRVNSTASIFIKPTVAFNCGDTFVFGSWVCTADGAGSFQHRLTMTPNPRTGLVILPEVITGDLARKFSEISLYNQHADFESVSASNSNSTSLWVTACESATEPSCADAPLHEHFPFGLCNASRAHAEALVTRRTGKEIVSDYTSDSNPGSGYYSDSSYEFDFESDPDEPKSENSTTEKPLSGPATGLVITSTPASRFVYWPDRKPADLTDGNSRYVAYLDSLPFQEGTPLDPTEEHTPTEVVSTDSSLGTPDRQVFMAAGETPVPSGTRPDRYFEDISADELSGNAPADETNDDKNAQRERNRKRNERRRQLYRRGATSGVLMKCVPREEGKDILEEIHKGVCGNHVSSRTLVSKAFQRAFYWPTALGDAEELVGKCQGYQYFAKQQHFPAYKLVTIPPTWPFACWGLAWLGLSRLRQEDSTELWWPSTKSPSGSKSSRSPAQRPTEYSASWMNSCTATDYPTASSQTWVPTSTTLSSGSTARTVGSTSGMSQSPIHGPTDKSSVPMGWYSTL